MASQALERAWARQQQRAGDRWRPRFHISVPSGWLNDPNGFSLDRGVYRLFYQYHPYSTVWGPMHWGYCTSRDMILWREEPAALAPDTVADAEGCFSGTAVTHRRKLYLMYTGVCVRDGETVQQQCLAVSKDRAHFVKNPGNPVIPLALLPVGASPQDFRDPKVRAARGGFDAIVASRGPAGGRLLRFSSPDLRVWRYRGVYLDGLADMAECPDAFRLQGRDVVIACQMGAEPQACGPAQPVTGFVGVERRGRFQPVSPSQALEQGLDFYAPQTTQTADGRRVMIGWMCRWGLVTPMHTQGCGWNGILSIPRELTLNRQGRLCQQPVEELNAYRAQARDWPPFALCDGQKVLVEQGPPSMDVALAFTLAKGATLTLCVLRTGDEQATVTCSHGLLRVDRSACGFPFTADGGPEPCAHAEAPIPMVDGRVTLRVVVDGSTVEVFAQDGSVVMSMLACPKGEDYGFALVADGRVSVERCTLWPLVMG
ncbi:MAG TPA: GH32 C-terminal domain-containing protein [Candidatus Limiplasma sp.]|nr:GH32 C-terminal domain-containing protein [Candidatus Limiplasma sp.]HPS81406.1 GH32 C-terminal domain-containing protein [Candidatus Limiplasma sp.]